MSSETSTEHDRSQPESASPPAPAGMQPWQFFVLAGLGCATAITFLARGQGVTVVLLMSLLMGTAVLVGLAALRAIRPLVSHYDDRAVVIGARTLVGADVVITDTDFHPIDAVRRRYAALPEPRD